MIYKYKPSQSKIAMGLLSFMFSQGDFQQLQSIIEKYEQDPEWKLFLYKEHEDFIGIIGGHETDEFIIHHLALSPSHRGEGIGCRMLTLLADQITTDVKPSSQVEQFYEKWQQKQQRHNSTS